MTGNAEFQLGICGVAIAQPKNPCRRHNIVLLSILLLLTACHPPAPPFQHQAYIWQRVWTPAVSGAVQRSAMQMSGWRVLVAETSAKGHLRRFTPDYSVLRATRRPIWLVVRIDGQLKQWDETALMAEILAIWRDAEAQESAPPGLEIDHDCGVAQLPRYAQFLARLRAQLPQTAWLSITALPAWLSATSLDTVLAAVDQSVLQVHAVRDPRSGLFDAAQAMRWAKAYARRAPCPWWLALPNYGSRVSWDAAGRIVGIESEAPLGAMGEDQRELIAMPQQVASLLDNLRRDPPQGLQGIAWFRLPTVQDRRAWSLATWLTVVRGDPLTPALEVSAVPGETAGVHDIVLRNTGLIDVPLPLRILLRADCPLADGIHGFRVRRQGNRVDWRTDQQGLLRVGESLFIGWIRCKDQQELQPYVVPSF